MINLKLDISNNHLDEHSNDEDTDSKQPKDIENERVLANEDVNVDQSNVGGKTFVNIILAIKSERLMVDISIINFDFVL